MGIVEIFRLTGKILVENAQANQAVEETTEKAKSGSNTMMNAFKGVATAVGTYLAVDKIVDFGKACVQASAQVKAQTAQFEASFGDMQTEAHATFSKIAEDTGVLATRLQTVGTSAFSQFKGSGLDAVEALKKADEFTRLAADGAAYYDMSLEEASSLMRSFIRGNTEAGDRLGLFTSEAQRNAYAMEKLGKKYIQCTESEKQMIMLDIASSIYESSGAMGQAQREADGYENVMGNLKESWRQFQAVIGAPILELVIPIVKKVTDGIVWLTEKTKGLTSTWSFSMEDIKKIWEQFGQPVFDKAMEVVATLYDGWQLILPSIQALWDNLVNSIKYVWENIGKPVFEFCKEQALDVYNMFMQYFPQVAQIVKEVFDLINQFWVEVLQPVFVHISHYVQNILIPFWEAKWAIIKEVVDVVFNAIVWAWDNVLKPLFEGIIWFLSNVLKGDWESIWDGIKTFFSDVLDSIIDKVKEIFGNIYDTIVEKLNSAKNFVSGIIEEIKGFFDFEWSLPDIQLPSISGIASSIGSKIGSALGFEGYANGGILEKPVAFGINPYSKNIMVGGESGKEAIAPIDELMGYVRVAVGESNNGLHETLNKMLMLLDDYLPQINQMQLVLDSGALVGEITPSIDAQLGNIQRRKER